MHFGTRRRTGVELKPGMIFTIEPMINLGQPHVKVLADGWTRRDARPVALGPVRAFDRASPRRATRSSPPRPPGSFNPLAAQMSVGIGKARARDRARRPRSRPLPKRCRIISATARRLRDRFRAKAARRRFRTTSCWSCCSSVDSAARTIKPLAKALIRRFGSFCGGAGRADGAAAGGRRASARPASARSQDRGSARCERMAKGAVGKRPVLSSWSCRARLLPHGDGLRRCASSSASCSSTRRTG